VIVVDTGVLFAATDANDHYHEAVVSFFDSNTEPLFSTPGVITEVSFLVEKFLGPEREANFLDSIARGDIAVEYLITSDYERMAELVRTYADLHLGSTDASVVAIAERLRATTVATLDHRHFNVVRPAHIDAFTIVP
jgi:predicted nucleic acid-binding protein